MSVSERTSSKSSGDLGHERLLTIALAVLSSTAATFAGQQFDSPVSLLAWALGALIVIGIVGTMLQRSAALTAALQNPNVFAIVIANLLAWPLLLELFSAYRSGEIPPIELALMSGCRNTLLGVAAIALTARQLRLAAALSLFLLVLAVTRLTTQVSILLVALYTIAGCCWLRAICIEPHFRARRQPFTFWWSTAGTLAMLLIFAACAALLNPSSASALRGWMPSSGGDRSGSVAATAGVGDGPDEVAGSRNARSIGFDQSNTFMNCDQPGLYDAFTETFGEPVKNTELVKLQMLHAKEIQFAASTHIEDYRVGRRFSLARQSPKPSMAANNHDAAALLYVTGTGPVHLRTAAFDAFENGAWLEAEPGFENMTWDLGGSREKPWFDLHCSAGQPIDLSTGLRSYQIRIGALKCNSIPFPPGVQRMSVGLVSRASLFCWRQADVLAMDRAAVPVGTVVDLQCGAFDPRRVTPWSWPAPPRGAAASVSPAITSIAKRWTNGVENGWPQIQAVTRKLQADYVLDRAFRHATPAAVEAFLSNDRRGPDYLFASAAALLLRGIGYDTRLVSGFYAAPGARDRSTGQAALSAQDAHVWAEVRVGGRWQVVEATPGYEVAGPPESLLARILFDALRAVADHPLAMGFCIAALAAVIWNRLRLCDLLLTLRHRAQRISTAAELSINTAKLLETRARLAGLRRPIDLTISRWLSSSTLNLPVDLQPSIQLVGRAIDEATYAPTRPPLAHHADLASACRMLETKLTAIHLWRQRRLRQDH